MITNITNFLIFPIVTTSLIIGVVVGFYISENNYRGIDISTIEVKVSEPKIFWDDQPMSFPKQDITYEQKQNAVIIHANLQDNHFFNADANGVNGFGSIIIETPFITDPESKYIVVSKSKFTESGSGAYYTVIWKHLEGHGPSLILTPEDADFEWLGPIDIQFTITVPVN